MTRLKQSHTQLWTQFSLQCMEFSHRTFIKIKGKHMPRSSALLQTSQCVYTTRNNKTTVLVKSSHIELG